MRFAVYFENFFTWTLLTDFGQIFEPKQIETLSLDNYSVIVNNWCINLKRLNFLGLGGLYLRVDFGNYGVVNFLHTRFGSFLLVLPLPTVEAQNLTIPLPPPRSEVVSAWLKSTRTGVKTLRRLSFRISIMVWGELNQWGGINRKDPSIFLA